MVRKFRCCVTKRMLNVYGTNKVFNKVKVWIFFTCPRLLRYHEGPVGVGLLCIQQFLSILYHETLYRNGHDFMDTQNVKTPYLISIKFNFFPQRAQMGRRHIKMGIKTSWTYRKNSLSDSILFQVNINNASLRILHLVEQ